MPEKTVVHCRRIRPEQDADIPLPRYMTPHSAGMDICAAVEAPVILEPGEIRLIPTGIAISLPEGFEAQIRPRSGLAVKHGIGLINSPGTIDADYRGEIKIPLINLGKEPFTCNRADRIAQMIVNQICRVSLALVDVLDKSDRSDGGFGHTGL